MSRRSRNVDDLLGCFCCLYLGLQIEVSLKQLAEGEQCFRWLRDCLAAWGWGGFMERTRLHEELTAD